MSTKDETDHFSGRGVGLSAVRAAVMDLGGRIEIESSLGLGTKLRFWFRAPGTIESVARIKAALTIPPTSLVSRSHIAVSPRTGPC